MSVTPDLLTENQQRQVKLFQLESHPTVDVHRLRATLDVLGRRERKVLSPRPSLVSVRGSSPHAPGPRPKTLRHKY